MQAQTSDYQLFKLWLEQYVPIERDILHVMLGAGLLAVAFALTWRNRRLGPFLAALAIAMVLAVLMELLDRRDDLRVFGAWRWQASLGDIIRTTFFPAVGALVVWLRLRRP